MLIDEHGGAGPGAGGTADLLRDAYDKLRACEAAQRQGAEVLAAILNAMPVHIALIDRHGVILAVNELWRCLATANMLAGSDFGVGQNYPDVCARARDDGAGEAQTAAVGIRRVLHGEATEFTIEYPCHSPTEQRWFQLRVTPVRDNPHLGAVVIHVNCTERKQAAEAAQRSHKRLRDLIDGLGASNFVGLMTPEGILIEANRPALAAAGLTPDDVLGKPFADTYWWAYSRDVQEQLRDAIARAARGEASRYDVLVRVAEHRLIEIDFSLQPVRDETGAIVFLVPSGIVIAERKQNENALRESNEKFQQLANNITHAFWIRSPDMRELRYLSPAFERIWGRPVESLSADPRQWTEFILPEDRERVQGVYAGLATNLPSVDVEYRIVRPDGEIRWVQARGFQVRDDAGVLISLTGIITDITERRVLEAQLEELSAEHAVVLNSLGEGVHWIDGEGQIRFENPAAAEMLGYEVSELIGKPAHPTMHHTRADGTVYPQSECGIYATLRDGMARRVTDEVFWRKDGTSFPVEYACTPVHDKNGRAHGSVVVFSNITERKEAAAALRRSTEDISLANRALQVEIVERKRAEAAAQTANRSKSEFLANMSHEIRTPLNGVVGMTELALATDPSTELREYLDIVKASGQSLLTIIDDILDFSKIEAGKLMVDAIPFDLHDCLAAALRLLAGRAHLKGLELAFDIGPDVPTALVGDPNRLRQVVTNLMGNAVKFTEHGEVVLTVVAETRTDRDAILRFSVSDTGIGVPREQQEAIFKPFIQADGSTTRKYGGTGLGLAISTSLVALMGGRIWLESEAGKGSTFSFTVSFDLQPAPAVQAKATAAHMMRLRDMPVLVVDDNAVNRRILDSILRRWLMKPVLAESGPMALAAMQAGKMAGVTFPLVLLDALMPEMDGFFVAREIKNDPALAGATLLMLTSAGQQGDGARGRAPEIAAYLTKPVGQKELLAAIFTVLGVPSDTPDRIDVVPTHTLRDDRRQLRILLAEDNKVNQMVAARLLEKRGHTVVIAGTGRDALAELDAAGSKVFDLILMDVQMPDMDGFEATAIIREGEQSSRAHMPIIAMTAHAMKGDRERCLAAGMDGYVSKPIHIEELFEAIARVI